MTDKVIVDGIIFELQSQGGASRIFQEILPRMNDISLTLLNSNKPKQLLPKAEHIRYRSLRYKFLRELWVGRGKNKIWHSTYYTLPNAWEGKTVITVLDMIYERYKDIFNAPDDDLIRAQKKKAIEQADAVICISQATRDDVQEYYGLSADKLHVVHLGCSDEFKQISKEDVNQNPYFLYVGARAGYKNFNCLLEAYKQFSLNKKVDLVVVGVDFTDQERGFIKESGLEAGVKIMTNVDDETLSKLYNNSSAFIYPSLYEGFGIPLLEAMSCGCPIIASRIPSTIEVAGECPIYFEPTDVDGLLRAFDHVLQEGKNSARVRDGLQKVQDYSWDTTAQKTKEIYQSL